MRMSEMTAVEVSDLLRSTDSTAVLPVGSTEQHGAHMTVDTDTYLVECVAAAACDGTSDVLMPSVGYGYNEKELSFGGTISLRAETFLQVLVDLGRSLQRSGWRRVLIINGHGWNNDLARAATHVLNEHRGFTAATCSYWSLVQGSVDALRTSPVPGGMAHACEFETSMMLHLRGSSVRSDLRVDEISYRRSSQHHHDLFHKSAVFIPEPFEDLSKSGVIGCPSQATAPKGHAWFSQAVSSLRRFLIEFREGYPRSVSKGAEV